MYWLDLLIILAIGIFVATRFFGFKLPDDPTPKGKREGWKDLIDKLQPPNPHQPAEQKSDGIPLETQKAAAKKPVKLTGLAAIKEADPGFEEATFLHGVEKAYHYFYESWNAQDEEALAHLASPQLMENLAPQMEDFETRDTIPNVAVEKITHLRIESARLAGRTAIIEVSITAKQREGEGTKTGPLQTVTQTWVLARPLTSSDPNWELANIKRDALDA